ncbi:AEC family transporter [Hyphomicrobium sulfonivorans]|uniref:AEC family transporter n=1 Tax=Hyphomicrobium sulfonivorans TaxID=121290 RepID=UPI00156F6976|nr:AEC family transporter [Hyphomicrobium sulfonivorans]MBI1650459.1 AEC family transporter [Hyphomicrobium sulfonivorans]NSL72181.1 transporter [Hyphomicrobium sulfonivorans]
MLSLLAIVAPIFALILCGFIARRGGSIGAAAVSEINKFVVYLALPALLFDVMAHASWQQLYQPGFVLAFGLSCGIVFYASVGISLLLRRPLADGGIDGLLGSYSNTAYMGFPLFLMVYGPDSLVPVTIASIITVCVLFASSIVLIEIGSQREPHPFRLAMKVGGALVRNPLLIAPVAGALYNATGLAVPQPAETFLKLLGGAASPAALVVIGLFLAGPRPVTRGEAGAAVALSAVKLILHPALTFFIAMLLGVPTQLAVMATLLAALPTGTGPFMLAELYRRPAAITSAVILISTLAALITLPIAMAVLGVEVLPGR